MMNGTESGSVLPYLLGQQTGFGGGYGGGNNNAWNNPLAWLIALGTLGGRNGGGLFGNNGSADAAYASNTADALRDIQAGVSTAAVGNANQTATLAETMNRIAADQAACCCSTKLEIANQGASIREGNLAQTNAIQLGFMGAQNNALQNFAALQLQACQNTNALQTQLAACCCETQKEILRMTNAIEGKGDQILNATAMQTAALTMQATQNKQEIIDRITANREALLVDQLSQCRTEASNCSQNQYLSGLFQTLGANQAQGFAAIIAAIQNTCGKGSAS